jgi:hypothetical protein
VSVVEMHMVARPLGQRRLKESAQEPVLLLA